MWQLKVSQGRKRNSWKTINTSILRLPKEMLIACSTIKENWKENPLNLCYYQPWENLFLFHSVMQFLAFQLSFLQNCLVGSSGSTAAVVIVLKLFHLHYFSLQFIRYVVIEQNVVVFYSNFFLSISHSSFLLSNSDR